MSEQAIDQGHESYLRAMLANDPEAFLEVLWDDVVLYPPNEDTVHGRAGARAWFEGVLEEAKTEDVETPERKVMMAGDWGVEQGKYVWTLNPEGGGDPFTTTGHFSAIWRRGRGDAWKISSNLWNSTDPT